MTQKVDSVKEADVQYTIHGREGGDRGRSVNEWEKEETGIVEIGRKHSPQDVVEFFFCTSKNKEIF